MRAQSASADALVGAQGVLAPEGVDRRDREAALQDGAHGRFDGPGPGAQQTLDRRGPLGHPRPVIEQRGRGKQRRDVDFDEAHAQPADTLDGPLIEPWRLGVAQPVELVGARQADGRHFDGRRRRRAPRIGIVGVEPGGHIVHQRRVGGRRGQHGDAVEAAAGRHDAARAPAALGRLQAHQVVERRRHAARAGGVGAEREGDEARRHRHRRAGTGAAADVVAIVDRAAGPVGRARPDQAGGELVEVGLADQHRAGRNQPFDHRRARLGRVGEGRAGGGGREARDIDVVLHRERRAGQRQALARRDPRIDRPRLGQNLGFGDAGDPDRRLHRLIGRHAVQRRAGDVYGAAPAGADLAGDPGHG